MAVRRYPVVWLDEAKENKEKIELHLSTYWSQKEVRHFYQKLDEHISLIAANPNMFKRTQARKNIRRSVLTKQTTLYYKFDGQQIEILFLFDTRQDPESLPLDK